MWYVYKKDTGRLVRKINSDCFSDLLDDYDWNEDGATESPESCNEIYHEVVYEGQCDYVRDYWTKYITCAGSRYILKELPHISDNKKTFEAEVAPEIDEKGISYYAILFEINEGWDYKEDEDDYSCDWTKCVIVKY